MGLIPVSVDLMGEQKTILAYLSMRQFWLVVPTGVFSIVQLVIINYPFVSGMSEGILKFIIFLLINITTICLAFIKIEKYDSYLSSYIMKRIHFMRSQKRYTN